jgi:hypothetical protein
MVRSVGALSTFLSLPMTLPEGLTAAEPSRESRSNWRYSVGLDRPQGSKPASPGRVPSRYAGGSGLDSQPFHRVRLGPMLPERLPPAAARLGAGAFLAGAFLAGAFLAGAAFLKMALTLREATAAMVTD